MKLGVPRGIRDLDPELYEFMEFVRDEFKAASRLFGFRLTEPASLEFLSTLEIKGGPSIRDEIYAFKDKSGMDVALRFDLTVGMARYVASRRGLPLPLKLASFSSSWRYDEPQYGRYRWFYQWDVEIFGPKDVLADAEVIEFTHELHRRIGLDLKVRIGDRRMTEGYIRGLGVEEGQKVLDLMRAIDKLDKKSESEVKEEYVAKGYEAKLLDSVLALSKIRGGVEAVDKVREFVEPTRELLDLFDLLKGKGLDPILDMGVVRGLDYYDSLVFEVFDDEEAGLGAVAGGGRYDVLMKEFGRPELGATGAAGGVDRLILSLKRRGLSPKTLETVVVAYTSGLEVEASKLVSRLRADGIACEMDPFRRSLRKQLELASKKARYVVIVAPRELEEGLYVLRDMKSGEELKLDYRNLVGALTRNV